MRRFTGVAGALVAVAVLGAAPAGAGTPHPSCFPKGSHTDAAGNRIRVFQIGDPSSEATAYACDLKTGKRRLLWETGWGEGEYASEARFAGTAAAWRRDWFLKEYSSQSVMTIEMKSGRVLRGGLGGGHMTDLEVAPTGSAVYGWRRGREAEVVALTPAERRPVASGDGIQQGSVALSRTARIYWTDAGRPHAAQLEPAAAEPRPFSAGGKRFCYPRRSRTLASGPFARVYVVEGSDSTSHYACRLSTGRRVLIASSIGSESYRLDRAALAGPYVALAGVRCAEGVCEERVQLADLRTAQSPFLSRGEATPGRFSDLLVRADGATAWIRVPEPGASGVTGSVRACDDTGCRTLDEGTAVEPGSLAQPRLGRVYWTSDGEPHAAPFGGPR
jgi:hypothetical protein